MLEEDPDFSEEFKRVFNNDGIPEADGFKPEVLEHTYADMEIAMSRDIEDTKFSKVKKLLRVVNGIPIGRDHFNPIFNTRVYEFEYLDGHKASLSDNTISDNLFSQVDEEVNLFVLFDWMMDHLVDST